MTDRELLELASKVADIPNLKYWGSPCTPFAWIYDYKDAYDYKTWNPLTDDGDALRLACRLSADVFINQITIRVEIGRIVLTQEISRGDKPAATRRAITRAAAEIGKQK